MPRATLRGHNIHFQQVGQGPDVVLIHGLFCNIAFWWFRVAPRLAERHRVTALDLRGHGFSAMSDDGYRTIDLAEDVAALMAHLDIHDAHVIGHSFGGAVALAVAIHHPERVRRLTLADAWVPSLQEMPPLAENKAWPALQKRLRARGVEIEGELPRVAQSFFEELLDSDEMGEGAIAGLGGMGLPAGRRGGPPRQSRALRRWRELMDRTPAHVQFRDPEGLEAHRLAGIDRPVDLIYGARSRYLQSRDGLARALPRHRSVTVPRAGHYFPLLRPEALLRALATGDKTQQHYGAPITQEQSID